MHKRPLEIAVLMDRIREAIKPWPKAAMFELYEEGFNTAFEMMVACIISIRTRDETMLPLARGLFARAHTPAQISALPVGEIDRLIGLSGFHETKASQIQKIAQRVVSEFGGELPCNREVFLSFAGVGPKCANLVLGIACGQAHIGVDTHVHRVTNRWGYVETGTPEATMAALEARLPKRYWVDINQLLVPFGKHICTPQFPHCSTCPVLDMCRQVGVTRHR